MSRFSPLRGRLGANAPACVLQRTSMCCYSQRGAFVLFLRWQLPLVYPTFCHKIGHFAANYPSFVVEILNFCAADMCAKRRKKLRNEGFCTTFEA